MKAALRLVTEGALRAASALASAVARAPISGALAGAIIMAVDTWVSDLVTALKGRESK